MQTQEIAPTPEVSSSMALILLSPDRPAKPARVGQIGSRAREVTDPVGAWFSDPPDVDNLKGPDR